MIFWASLNLLTFSVMVAVYARIYVYVRRKGKRMSQHSSHQLRHNETVFNLMKTISIVLGEWDLERTLPRGCDAIETNTVQQSLPFYLTVSILKSFPFTSLLTTYSLLKGTQPFFQINATL